MTLAPVLLALALSAPRAPGPAPAVNPPPDAVPSDDVREQVQGLLEEAIADAQSKLAGRAVPRLSDHAIGAMAAIMGRRLRGMFED